MAQDRLPIPHTRVVAHIERFSLSAAALLQCHSPIVGRIHSRYDRILNIQAPDGQLLTLQGSGLLQAPCAASLTEPIECCVSHLTPGDLVTQADDVPAALCLATGRAQSWDGRLLPLVDLTSAKLHDIEEKLVGWLTQRTPERGITPVLAALKGRAVPSPLHRRLYEAFTPMLATRQVTAVSLKEIAGQVIGLGTGLTPSGDDLLVGFFAVLHRTGYAAVLLDHSRWLDILVANTTDLSAAFLRGALAGHFSEPMVRLMHAIYRVESCDWHSPAADLARVGHSSGVDAMVGMALATHLLAGFPVVATP